MQCDGVCRERKGRKFTRAGASKIAPELQVVEATTIDDIKKKFELGWDAHKVKLANKKHVKEEVSISAISEL